MDTHKNGYVYASINYPDNVIVTLGISADLFDSAIIDRQQVNPKIGLIWAPSAGTTLRAAAVRTLKRTLISSQTVEPTQVAGFNQFFDDGNATDSWRYGLAIDQKVSPNMYVGAEVSKRDLVVPTIFTSVGPGPSAQRVVDIDREEKFGRGLLVFDALGLAGL